MSVPEAALEPEKTPPNGSLDRVGRKVRVGLVRDLKKTLSGVETLVVARLEKVSTKEVNALRNSLKPLESTFWVVKNNLGAMAFRDLGWPGLQETLKGTCAVATVRSEPTAVCRVLRNFSKEHEGFVLAGGILDGEPVLPQDLIGLAELPSREVLLALVAGVAQSPLRNLVFLLTAPMRSLAMVVEAVRQKKA